MKYQHIPFLLFGFLSSLTLPAKAQVLDSIKSSFTKYHEHILQEKIFVHTDKTYYMAGEIIWFKVYNVAATINTPLDVSKVAYVEILGNDNLPLLQTKIYLKNGLGSGSLYIPLTAANGKYSLRCYTSWMKNFSPDFYFAQPIAIVNSLISPQTTKRDTSSAFDIRFFPEGGRMVNGIKSTIAFKAVTPNGMGVDLTGIIINQHNDTVARFKSLKFGMGHFSFTPLANNTYKTIIRSSQGKLVIKNLSDSSPQGYVMQVSNTDSLQLTLKVNCNIVDQRNDVIYVFVHSGEFVKIAEALKLNNGAAQFILDKRKLGDGISHITLFNSARQPICERLYFKRPKQLLISAATDVQLYGVRKKLYVDIATQSAGKPAVANLSLSVYRLDSLESSDPLNIQSYLWLNAELKGNIESPNYYLKNHNPDSDEALDNLMMTQGWSRFDWPGVLKETAPAFKFLPEYAGHIITVKVTEKQAGNPVKNVNAYLGITGKRAQVYAAGSDLSGRLLFDTKNLYGKNELVLQCLAAKDSIYRLDVLNPFSEQYSTNLTDNLTFDDGIKRPLEIHHIAMQAQNIFNADKIKIFDDPLIDSTAFYGKAKTYLLDQYTRFTTVEEVLREYVSEVNLLRQQKKLHIKIINGHDYLNDDPLLIFDGIPILNSDKVMAVDPLKIKKLEVVPQTYHLGRVTAEGVLSFTTYKGDLAGIEIDSHAVVLDYEGIQLQRTFYSPMYETESQLKSRLPDFRTLLYWEPNVISDSMGKKRLSFYTSDETGKYIGVINGTTKNGLVGSQSFTFEVKD